MDDCFYGHIEALNAILARIRSDADQHVTELQRVIKLFSAATGKPPAVQSPHDAPLGQPIVTTPPAVPVSLQRPTGHARVVSSPLRIEAGQFRGTKPGSVLCGSTLNRTRDVHMERPKTL
jgi:hypothetical protein